MIVTIIRLYDDHSEAANVVAELCRAGVPEQDISMIIRDDRASGAAKGAEIGALVGGLAGLAAGLGLLVIPGVGPALATGWLVSTLTGAALGAWAGGALGVLSQAGVSGQEAQEIAECLRRGATMVAARVPEAEKDRYETILNRGCIDLRVRVAAYRRAGWTAHDPSAAPYTPEEIKRERELHGGR
jgi:hypothetical protein